MGTHYRKSPLPPKKLEISDDDDDSFIFGISSESEFSDESSAFEEDVDQLPLEPKDPRSKAKYNIFSRLLFLLVKLIRTMVHDNHVATQHNNNNNIGLIKS